jgi:4-hydroxy-tetrahydrodipicolinate synthase
VADLANDTTLRLAQIPNVVGIKDATGSMERCSDLLARAPRDFALYSGDDASGLALLLLGGHGVISVTANVAPAQMAAMCAAALAGDIVGARALNRKMLALHFKLFVEANPIPVKWALQQMGRIEGGIRLPMTPLEARNNEQVMLALRQSGVLA